MILPAGTLYLHFRSGLTHQGLSLKWSKAPLFDGQRYVLVKDAVVP